MLGKFNRLIVAACIANVTLNGCMPIDLQDLPTNIEGITSSPLESPTPGDPSPTPSSDATGTPTDITTSPTATPIIGTPSPTTPAGPTPTPTATATPGLTPTPTATATPGLTPPPTPTVPPTPTPDPTPTAPADIDGDGVPAMEDCDDNDPSQYPGAQEGCTGEDDDCDGQVDEGAGVLTYPDVDGDSYGDNSEGELECVTSDGRSTLGGDCDDQDRWRNPGVPFEYQDDIDNDCDLQVDEVQLASSAAWTTSGSESYSWTGSSLLGIGDFDQDGLDDFAVGDSFGDDTYGRVTIFYGQEDGALPSAGADQSWLLRGDQEIGQAGLAIAAGDFNGDSIPDIAVGQPVANRVTIVFGGGPRRDGQDVLEDIGTTVTPPKSGLFGNALAGADMDGDGDDDLIIGSPGYELVGRTYILFGRAGLEQASSFGVMDEGRALDNLVEGVSEGYTAVAAGDINNDGEEDVLVGAWYGTADIDDDRCEGCGVVEVIYGDSNTSKIGAFNRTALLVGQFEGSGLGWGVGSAGNLNGDRFDDIVVGAPSYRSDGDTIGRAYVILGREERYEGEYDVRSRAHIVINGSGAGEAELGNLYSVGSPGDVNGDGYDDLWVGGVAGRFTGNQSVGVGALFLGSSFDVPEDRIYLDIDEGQALFQGSINNGNFGSVGPIGDLNNDGYDDLLLGAYTAQVSEASQGQAYLFWGYPGSN